MIAVVKRRVCVDFGKLANSLRSSNEKCHRAKPRVKAPLAITSRVTLRCTRAVLHSELVPGSKSLSASSCEVPSSDLASLCRSSSRGSEVTGTKLWWTRLVQSTTSSVSTRCGELFTMLVHRYLLWMKTPRSVYANHHVLAVCFLCVTVGRNGSGKSNFFYGKSPIISVTTQQLNEVSSV